MTDDTIPRCVITLLPDKGIQVELHNWTGVGMGMMERMYHELLKSVQRHRATSLQQMRQAEELDKLLKETESG